MAINVNVNGMNKNVISPEVYVDGTWRQVNVVKNNINGIWRESYNRNVYKIKLYRYGVLYDTLSVNKGSSIVLPSVPIVQSDDVAHYGWTTTAGSTTRNYSPTATITPTSNMDLFAVFSYNIESEEMSTATATGYSTGADSTTVTVAWDGTAKIYAYTTHVRVDHYNGNNTTTNTGGFALSSSSDVTVTINNTYVTGTVSDTAYVTRDVKAGDQITINAVKGSSDNSAGSSYNYTVTITHYGIVEYPAIVTVTKYRSS